MNKIRGFEKISELQFDKDVLDNNIKYENIILPKRATKKSAGYDFFAPVSIVLEPNEEIKFPTGIKIYMLDDEDFTIMPRSGLGFKYYCRLANTLGLIDADYYNNESNEGHCWVKLRNEGKIPMIIKAGEAYCQGVFRKHLLADNDDTNDERQGGLGSTTKVSK